MPEDTDFLYPFIEGDERDTDGLLTDLASSAEAKAAESSRVTQQALEANRDEISAAAHAMADRLRSGACLFTFGNGGSSTDAASLAALFATPVEGTPVAARCLVDDTSIITALGNDVGFELVFSRQLIAHGRDGDIALGLSTSGNSRNLLVAFAEAKRRGMSTIGIAGYDGGEMSTAGLDHCLVVRSDSVHRIQEAQAALGYELWRRVQDEFVRAPV
jgi:D-sedoheptulose 7-phosphate isomerase